MPEIAFPFGDTIYVLRETTTLDSMGEPESVSWDVVDEIENVAVAHGPSSDAFQVGRNPLDIALTIHIPQASAGIRPTDRVEVRGEVYDVYGQPFHWKSPFTGKDFGWQVDLKTRQG